MDALAAPRRRVDRVLGRHRDGLRPGAAGALVGAARRGRPQRDRLHGRRRRRRGRQPRRLGCRRRCRLALLPAPHLGAAALRRSGPPRLGLSPPAERRAAGCRRAAASGVLPAAATRAAGRRVPLAGGMASGRVRRLAPGPAASPGERPRGARLGEPSGGRAVRVGKARRLGEPLGAAGPGVCVGAGGRGPPAPPGGVKPVRRAPWGERALPGADGACRSHSGALWREFLPGMGPCMLL
mmetsp:Transcript_42237/g.100191  ORF Transcript_42237/g.100191 Transcript_42237/m.100191 type:complete len:239 (+) Transcript_42237:1196-1912(+)